MDRKIKHLEMIQGVINRLADNSFRIKGWSVVLVSALFVLLVRENRVDLAWIGLFPVLIFWGLDGYFLMQERLFRDLYDRVRSLDEDDVDFSMSTANFGQRWTYAVFSRTLVPFHAVLIGMVVSVAFFG